MTSVQNQSGENLSPAASHRGLTILAITVVWLALALGGFPFPHVDDAFHIGAGLNLAQGGPFENPLVENSGAFFRYPPLYSYVIALWLKLFGISAASMVALHVSMCWGAALCVVRGCQLLQREVFGWAVALTILVYSACVGMRPDNCALFFLALSFRSGVSPKNWVRLLSPLFAFLAVSSLPAIMALAFPWVIYLLVTYRNMWKALIGEGVATVILMCVFIHWRIREFLAVFLYADQDAKKGNTEWVMTNWYRPMGLVKIVYPIVALTLLIFLAVRRRGFRMVDTLMALSLLLGLYTMLNSASGHRVVGLITVVAIGYYIYTLLPGSRWAHALVAANALLIIGSGLRPLFQGVTTAKPANGAQLLEEVKRLGPSRIIVDQWSLRYVFNERLLPGMISLRWASRPGTSGPLVAKKYPDECWVLSAESVAQSRLEPHGLPEPHTVSIAGRQIGEWLANAGEIGISPPGK